MSASSHDSESYERSGAGDTTRALDVQSIGRTGALAAWAVALAGGVGSYLLVGAGGRAGWTGGILLGVVALGALAVGLQATGEPWPGEPGYGDARADDPASEEPPEGVGGAEAGYLPLSDRLALGVLGGALGGIAVTLSVWIVDAVGLSNLLDVHMAGGVTGASLALRSWYGALWGLVLALLWPRLPGRSSLSRATTFGLAPALYALLVLYPLVLDLGWFAAELGALTFVFVVAFHLLWGAVAGGVFRWAETTDLGVLSRPLVGR